MAYNKAKAEQEWLLWKEAEEKTMREKGVDEDTIQRLHEYDWKSFKAERNYQRWQIPSDEYIRQLVAEEDELPTAAVDQLLWNIENPKLLAVLSKTDKLTLEAVVLNMSGYCTEEICQKLGLSSYAYYNRIKRLKNKIKNIF